MEGFAVERVTPVLGLAAIMGLAWLIGDRKRNVSLRIVLGGLALQFALALFILKTWIGVALFSRMGEIFTALLGFVEAGSLFVFGEDYAQHFFAFQLLPTIIFTSAVMSVLFHLGVLQRIVAMFAWTMRRTLGTSGAESFAAAANVFVGQTEAPLMVRPYINGMTRSELMSLMTGGFATIAGSLFVVYASMGVDAGHLIGASVISAPAALLIAKLMIPETEHSLTLGAVEVSVERSAANVMDALTEGAQNGLRIALNVAALLIAIIAIVAMLNALLTLASGWVSGLIYGDERWAWTIQAGLGYAFAPFGWLMGVPWGESLHAGQLLGERIVLNEFIAYATLGEWLQPGSEVTLSDRTVVIMTFAICGFCNFGSIGIQVAGIGQMAPDRRPEITRLAFRAMLAGALATMMTGCVAALLI